MTEIECAINNHSTVDGISPYADGLVELLKSAQSRIAELEQDNQEQCRLNAMGAEREARLMVRVTELEKFKTAYEEWHDKTEWVQETATYKELGKHRADVLRDRIAELEKDAARWKAATRDLDINDVAVVVYDKYGDERVVTGDDADSAIDTAMQKD